MPKGRRKTLKGRGAWRKIDISDITDGARQNTDDLLAGGAVSSKTSAQLFSVDKRKAKPVSLTLDPEARKARARAKSLKIDELSMPNPHTKAESRGPVVTEAERLKKKRTFEKMVREVESGDRKLPTPLDPRSEIAGKLRSRSLEHDCEDTTVKSTKSGVFDLWAERDVEKETHDAIENYLGYSEDWYQPARKKPKLYAEERTSTASKRSGRQAVEIAAPGTSYHPEYEAHQEVLQDSLDYYTRKAALGKKLAKRMPSFKKQPEPLVFEESDTESSSEESDMEGQEDGNGASSSNGEVVKVNVAHIARKTKEEKDKEFRQRKHQAMLIKLAQKKKENRDYFLVKKMAKEADEMERVREARREAKAEVAETRAATRIIRSGPAHYQHRAPEVAFTEELSGNFRGLKSTGSLLEDRFASLQRRNLIEVRHRTKRQNHTSRTKTFTKSAFKEAPTM